MQLLITFLIKKKGRIVQLHISMLVVLLDALLENMFIKMKRGRQDRTRQGPFSKGAVDKIIQLT